VGVWMRFWRWVLRGMRRSDCLWGVERDEVFCSVSMHDEFVMG
jgi:hypothetical protein